jgi:hypothetical protein
MSADGNLMVALNLNVNTFQYEYAVYRYSSGVWNFETSFPIVGDAWLFPVISGNGNTILLFSGQNIRVFEYVDSEWTGPNLITDVTTWSTSGTRSFNVSYDGYTVILTVPSASNNQLVYVCTKNQDLTWNSLTQIQPADSGVNYFRLGSTYVAISGDAASICVNTEEYLYPFTRKSWVYTRTGESTWGSPVLLSSGFEYFEQIDMSYDGQTIALLLADPNIATIWLHVYTNGTLSKDITLPFPQTNYLPGVIKLSYDGSLLLFAQYFNVTLYTRDSQITVSDTTNDFPFAAASMNSSGSRIVNVAISLTNPITYFFDAGGAGQPGSFLPSGTGSGISGAGYLTDGQQTDPFFGFLKPKAYVNGGFGNSYEYGQPGVPKEGGFGGGQSPLNKKTSLTSVTGYKQVRPSIPVNGVRQMNSIALSEDGNTFLASGQRQTGTPLNFTNVYTYIDSSWTNTNISDELSYVSTSADGSVWLINGDVWRNGSFETTLDTVGSYSMIPGLPRSSISSDGNTVVVLSVNYTYPGVQYTLNVFTYSGTWNSISLPLSPETPNDIYALQCVISGDGSTIVLNVSEAIPTVFTFVDVYTKAGETWSSPNRIYTNTSITSGTLGINSNGSEIVFARTNQNYSLYSNGTITTFPSIENISFSRTNPDFYVYSIGNKIYAPSISLDVTININDKNSYIASGSNIVATTDSSSPYAFLFVDMYDPTTTCTAATSVAHGYPYDYEVQITGTKYFDGTWLITAVSSNTFTFQAFGGPTVTSGYVSGTATGISGGGGYTGSAGDGVSGATCYADPSVVNFTDLGATSNSAGYVTVTLMDPVPLQPTWSWDDESPWESINSFQSNAYTVTWCESLGLFVVGGKYTPLSVNISRDGKEWQQTNATYYDYYQEPMVSSTDKPIIVWGAKTSVDGLNWVDNNKLYGFVVYCNGMFINSVNYDIYTSTDGFTWNIVAFSTLAYTVRAYGNNKYVGISSNGYGRLVYSEDLVTWNYANSMGGEYGIQYSIDVSFGNGVFVSYNTNNDIYTSTDGISWTYQTFPNDFPGTIQHLSNLIFGGSIFLVVKEYVDNSQPVTTTSSYFYTSSHGDTWTKGVVALNYVGIISITYSPSLDFFIFLNQNALPYLTLDGQYFVPGGNYFVPYNFTNIVYSPTSGVIVVGNYTSTDQGVTWTLDKIIDPVDYDRGTTSYNVLSNDRFFKFMSYYNSSMVIKVRTYTSFDGLDWTYEGENDFELFGIPFWCQARGYFIANGKYLSKDGVNWTLLGNQNTVVTAYSETLGLFTGYDSNDQYQQFNGQNYYSYDGYNWTLADESGINPISWSSSLKLFAGVKFMYYSYEENKPFFGIFVSSNGINWELSYLFSDATPRGVTWSPELEKFFIYLPGKSNDPSYFYDKFIESSDGYNWSTVQLNTTSNPSYWKDTFAWVSGLDRFVLSHDELVSIRVLFSTKAIKQF